MSKPIDGLEPLPPPPPEWRPGRLVRADEAKLESAARGRVERLARERGISLERACELVCSELSR